MPLLLARLLASVPRRFSSVLQLVLITTIGLRRAIFIYSAKEFSLFGVMQTFYETADQVVYVLNKNIVISRLYRQRVKINRPAVEGHRSISHP